MSTASTALNNLCKIVHTSVPASDSVFRARFLRVATKTLAEMWIACAASELGLDRRNGFPLWALIGGCPLLLLQKVFACIQGSYTQTTTPSPQQEPSITTHSRLSLTLANRQHNDHDRFESEIQTDSTSAQSG